MSISSSRCSIFSIHPPISSNLSSICVYIRLSSLTRGWSIRVHFSWLDGFQQRRIYEWELNVTVRSETRGRTRYILGSFLTWHSLAKDAQICPCTRFFFHYRFRSILAWAISWLIGNKNNNFSSVFPPLRFFSCRLIRSHFSISSLVVDR